MDEIPLNRLSGRTSLTSRQPAVTRKLVDLLHQITRIPFVLGLWARLPIGSVETRVQYGVLPYPQYAYGVYWAAVLASRLRIPRVCVLELGVAGGRGLVALEAISSQVENALGVRIEIVGFDTGNGLPAPRDYRDLPHLWDKGFYEMDQDMLRARLRRAQLVLGDISETSREWLRSDHAPIGFVAFDLDYYSSTKAAFALFEGDAGSHLPRVYCYFDDVATGPLGCMNEYVGELLAIHEFNESHDKQKICKIEQVRLHRERFELWQENMYALHDFTHPLYNTLVTSRHDGHLPL
jgi:hypothetical protein